MSLIVRQSKKTPKTVITVSKSSRPATNSSSRRPRRRNGPASSRGGGAAKAAADYADTISDPFEHGGVPLGYDCFLPTTQITSVVRGSFVVNATDGSFSIAAMPDNQSLVSVANGLIGAARTSSWTVLPATNAANVVLNFREGRTVSLGLRAFALFPETSAPGVLYAGTTADLSYNDFAGKTGSFFRDLPGSRLGIGTKGAIATGRPYDNDAFAFYPTCISGFAAVGIPAFTCPYIVGEGFPVTTRIYYEVSHNIEGIASSAVAGSLAVPSDDSPPNTTTATYYPTPGTLLEAASRLFSPSIVMDAADVAVNVGLGFAANGRRGALAAAAQSVRSAMGRGRNFASGYSQARGRESTVMIEEMQGDAMPPSQRSGGFVSVRRI